METTARFNAQSALRLAGVIKDLLNSEVRSQARTLLALLLLFALSVNALNVLNSYIGCDFMTAISLKDMRGFAGLGAVYVTVFAASTAVAVLYRFVEERLGLLWRARLTKQRTAG